MSEIHVHADRLRRETREPPPLACRDDAIAPALSGVVGYLLRRAHAVFAASWMARFRDSDTPVTPVQAGMMVVLAANPEISQVAFARMMNVEGPTLLQSIDRLEQRGYLRRVRRLNDRRCHSLILTPLGREVLAVIQDYGPIREAEMLADLTAQEREQLVVLLTKIVRRGQARLNAPHGRPASH